MVRSAQQESPEFAYLAPPHYQPEAPPALVFKDKIEDRSGHHGYYKPGIVGPVYTFVKTDYHGNVKWGVRHVAGKKYAGHH